MDAATLTCDVLAEAGKGELDPAALQGAGVEFVIQQDRQNGSFFGIGLQLVPPSVEYIIYVHEDDFELAQAALQGTLN